MRSWGNVVYYPVQPCCELSIQTLIGFLWEFTLALFALKVNDKLQTQLESNFPCRSQKKKEKISGKKKKSHTNILLDLLSTTMQHHIINFRRLPVIFARDLSHCEVFSSISQSQVWSLRR